MSELKGYVDSDYLQVAAKLLHPVKERSYDLMHIQSGQTLLDLGCGPGIDTIRLARLTGPHGKVVGIDRDTAMLGEARRQAQQAGLSACVEYACADAAALPFASGYFNACRSERLFMHVPHSYAAVTEMVRVTKPGGWIVVVDPDWGTASIDTTEIETERRLMRFRAEKLMHNGYSGRQLYRLFKQHQLTDIDVEILPICVKDYALARYMDRLDQVEQAALAASCISHDDLLQWRTQLEKADNAGFFFASVCMVMAMGRKS
jgi:ubiquinone/menaquinone biosynthesis C-methylase UbiE